MLAVYYQFVLDVRYHGADIFVGAPVDGSRAPVAILTEPAASALSEVQAALRERGYGRRRRARRGCAPSSSTRATSPAAVATWAAR